MPRRKYVLLDIIACQELNHQHHVQLGPFCLIKGVLHCPIVNHVLKGGIAVDLDYQPLRHNVVLVTIARKDLEVKLQDLLDINVRLDIIVLKDQIHLFCAQMVRMHQRQEQLLVVLAQLGAIVSMAWLTRALKRDIVPREQRFQFRAHLVHLIMRQG